MTNNNKNERYSTPTQVTHKRGASDTQAEEKEKPPAKTHTEFENGHKEEPAGEGRKEERDEFELM